MKNILIKMIDLIIYPLVILNGDISISTINHSNLEWVILYLLDLREYLVTGY